MRDDSVGDLRSIAWALDVLPYAGFRVEVRRL